MRGGGVPYCPWWGGPWGEHGVCAFDEPLRAGGRSCSCHYVVVPALEDCRQTSGGGWSLSVGGGGRSSSGVRRPVAQRAVSRVRAVACSHCSGWFGSAGWSLSAGACRRRMVPRRVTLVLVSCVRAWPHTMKGIQTCWPWACWRARQSTRSTMVSWRSLPTVVSSRRALTVNFVQLSCRRYQPTGVLRALPWRVARRRSGSWTVVGVRGERSGSRGGSAGWVAGVLRVHVDVWVTLVGLSRAVQCRVALWVRGGLWGALVVSWRPVDGDGRVWGAEWVSGRLCHAWRGNG